MGMKLSRSTSDTVYQSTETPHAFANCRNSLDRARLLRTRVCGLTPPQTVSKRAGTILMSLAETSRLKVCIRRSVFSLFADIGPEAALARVKRRFFLCRPENTAERRL
jgi:hypothetical protein